MAAPSARWSIHPDFDVLPGVWLAERMGLLVSDPARVPGEHFNHGSRIFGDKYIQRIRETTAGLDYEKPQLLSEWLGRESA